MKHHTIAIQAALAGIVTLGFFGVLALLVFAKIDAGIKDPLLILLGALSAAFGALMNYYFGSSSGSAKKDELMAGKP